MSNAALKTFAQIPAVSRARDLYSYWRDKRRGTYSQHGEDLWLDNHFAGRRNGYYVDIGASHPIRLSNTWKLYSERDWHGVTVEPIPAQADAHRRWRPRDTLVPVCIGTEPGTRTFYELSPSVLSTLDKAAANAAVTEKRAAPWRTYNIEVITLKQLFAFIGTSIKVDLLSVDMEGLDADVLTGFSFTEYRPRVIIAEANDRETREKLLTHLHDRWGYWMSAELGCNLIFES